MIRFRRNKNGRLVTKRSEKEICRQTSWNGCGVYRCLRLAWMLITGHPWQRKLSIIWLTERAVDVSSLSSSHIWWAKEVAMYQGWSSCMSSTTWISPYQDWPAQPTHSRDHRLCPWYNTIPHWWKVDYTGPLPSWRGQLLIDSLEYFPVLPAVFLSPPPSTGLESLSRCCAICTAQVSPKCLPVSRQTTLAQWYTMY